MLRILYFSEFSDMEISLKCIAFQRKAKQYTAMLCYAATSCHNLAEERFFFNWSVVFTLKANRNINQSKISKEVD